MDMMASESPEYTEEGPEELLDPGEDMGDSEGQTDKPFKLVFRIEEQLRYEAVPDVRRYIRRLKRRQDDLYKISCQTHVR